MCIRDRYWHQPSDVRGEQGLNLDISSGSITFVSDYGVTTATNISALTGTFGNDQIIGSSFDNKLEPAGGIDVITGGGGRDRYTDIYTFQEKLTITDYESFEEIEFDSATWMDGDSGYWGFTKVDIDNQLIVNYDTAADNTSISISTASTVSYTHLTLPTTPYV